MKNKSKSKIRLTLMGACGRMGARILSLVEKDSRFQVMAGVEQPGSGYVGSFVAKGKAPVVGKVEEVLPKTDVVIDFTSPQAILKTAAKVSKSRRALVIGTTGLTPAVQKKLRIFSRRIPIVFSPNMSMGMNMLFRLVQMAAEKLDQYDIEIIEAHHNQKKDSPSGTAVRLAEIATEASGRKQKDWVYGRKGIIGARKKKEVGVLAVRAGDIVGDHTVLLSHAGERLELVHRAHSRDTFATGALEAAAWIARRKPGLYNMFDVLKI
ncbi:4-hydroxy-tetrahydrodipicolinate reductase [bacterium F11]|nr:4-hydroxy-tetrahydrodipicolinate reductase [bacterium F11]